MVHAQPLLASLELTLGVAVLVLVPLFIAAWAKARRKNDAFKEAAAKLGLEQRGSLRIAGVLGGFEVEVAPNDDADREPSDVHVRIRGKLRTDLSLGRPKRGRAFDVVLGDDGFDEEVEVHGNEPFAFALLDAHTRDQVRDAVRDGWSLEGGTWTMHTTLDRAAHLASFIENGVALATLTRSAQSDVAERLLDRVRSESAPRVRENCIQVIRRLQPDALAAPLDVAAHGSPELRAQGAIELGEVARLIEVAARAGLSERARIECLRHAARAGRPEELAPLVAALAVEPGMPAGLALAFAKLLGTHAYLGGEAALIRMLASKDEALKKEAIRSLGDAGTIAAVAALTQLRDRTFPSASESTNLAKDAIWRIQARAGTPAGTLALTEEEESGRLALHDD